MNGQPLALEELAAAIANQLSRKLPLEVELWAAEQCADYFKVTKRQFAERYAVQPTFPKGKRLPSLKGQGQVRWKAANVIQWAENLPAA